MTLTRKIMVDYPRSTRGDFNDPARGFFPTAHILVTESPRDALYSSPHCGLEPMQLKLGMLKRIT